MLKTFYIFFKNNTKSFINITITTLIKTICTSYNRSPSPCQLNCPFWYSNAKRGSEGQTINFVASSNRPGQQTQLKIASKNWNPTNCPQLTFLGRRKNLREDLLVSDAASPPPPCISNGSFVPKFSR